jgi:hypothetical protein
MDKEHPKISMRRQSELLGVARSTAAYNPVAEDPEEIRIKRLLDETYLIDPCLAQSVRDMSNHLGSSLPVSDRG